MMGRCTYERRLIRSIGASPKPFWVTARCYPEDIEMRKHLITIRCSIKVDLAACLRALAVFVYLLS